ncbi:MFS transporter, partial [Acinetobacter baumannii]
EGALLDMGENNQNAKKEKITWGKVKQLLASRMMLGIFIGQYCVNTLTYFFLTWFPVYLVKERHLSILEAGFAAVAPALCGFIGGI